MYYKGTRNLLTIDSIPRLSFSKLALRQTVVLRKLPWGKNKEILGRIAWKTKPTNIPLSKILLMVLSSPAINWFHFILSDFTEASLIETHLFVNRNYCGAHFEKKCLRQCKRRDCQNLTKIGQFFEVLWGCI